MKNFRINPNKKLVDVIIEGLQKKDGHCPCRINVDDTTLCPCDEFIKDGICKCKLFIPIEKSVEDKDK
jgi:ferredoxin-thioredoxin reductase catalytic subunit